MKHYSFKIYESNPMNTWGWKENRGQDGKDRWVEIRTQEEYAYTEYRTDDFSIKGCGSEDFNMERKKKYLRFSWVWTWDGKKYNKGNHRWFERRGFVVYNRDEAKEVKEFLKKKYDAEMIELRSW
jgi:hypothetical protein